MGELFAGSGGSGGSGDVGGDGLDGGEGHGGGGIEWLMELGCETGVDYGHTDEGVESAKIATAIFRERLEVGLAGGGEDFVTSLSLDEIAKAQQAALADRDGVWHNGGEAW